MNRKQLFINLILLQIFFPIFLTYAVFTNVFLGSNYYVPNIIVFFLTIILALFSLWVAKEISRLADKEKQSDIVKVRFEEAEKLITTLKSKHHDFKNHLQVIMGLVQLNKNVEVVSYIKDLSLDLIGIEKLEGLEKPEVAALIGSKIAGLRDIRVSLDFTTSLAEFVIPPDKIVSILGNLIDNAIYETSLQESKWLGIGIHQQDGYYIFEISNPGIIPEQIKTKIFQPSFTTKGEKGTGMGLFIVEQLVAKLGGTVSVCCKEEQTRFTVKLPKVI